MKYRRDEMIEKLRLDPSFGEKLWGAFGFTHSPDGEASFTEEDLAALAVFVGSDGEMDPAAQLAAARVIGQSTARLAEWQADQIHALAANPNVPQTTDELAAAVAHVLELVWRRHLDNFLAYQDEAAADSPDAEGVELIIGFADIVGYTALSRRLGLHELAALLDTFESGAYTVINRHGGQIIKAIGDAVMFTAPTPSAAAAMALELHDLGEDDDLLKLRVGLAAGTALTRLGDVFGEPVNIAARLASSAHEGKTLIDEHLAEALAEDRSLYLRNVSALSVRGYRRLRATSLARNRRSS
ncbi:adenylate/guanylate cyclase domain-containing protein [Gordonia alkaliphila]|uniref:adenylate/guanylate cyclase domain-containing protein n=1 Tax=Gordonia alkaliphila TaxID=1053547 RepID=UPI001FF59997|nr:adenylate/guanylate cyclase domain-containing protein [Gordonia alkaliphila]MCK0438867.1 adenylate/guanylate cyclase domain-containing protein [Gordonia alkaliphila]